MRPTPSLISLGLACAAMPAQSALVTYTADANTVALFHMDENSSATSTVDAVSGRRAYAFDGNPLPVAPATAVTPITGVLGAPGFSGFGNAANISAADLALGFDANNNGEFNPDNLSTLDYINISSLTAANGSFTIDAMVNFTGAAVGGGNREIVSADNSQSSAANRGFQFRLNNSGQLEFNFIGTTSTAAATVLVPTTGTHAYAANTWFHTAMAFDGATGSVSFYWTKVDPSVTSANLIGTGTESVVTAITAPLAIGNENRNVTGEGLLGLLDEVRISKSVRGANDFIFTVPEPTSAATALAGLGLLLRRRTRRAGAR